MSTDVVTAEPGTLAHYEMQDNHEFVTMKAGGQLFGIAVLAVHDVQSMPVIARIPLAPPQIAGALNLRGRIVTVIDVRARLGLPPRDEGAKTMSVVVEHGSEQYSLLVDSVSEVLSLPAAQFEKNPGNLAANWKEVSSGIYRLKGELLVVLDVDSLLNF